MPLSPRKSFIVVCALSLFLTVPLGVFAQEQSSTPTQKSATTPEAQPSGGGSVDQGTTGELAQASREAAGEDESNFNQYPSVMMLAHFLHVRPFVAFWLSILFNFAVLAGALGYMMKKYLPGAFRNRTASIQRAMAEAQRSSEEARRRLAEIENRLSRLDIEIAGMREAAEKDAAAEEARIRAATEEDTRKVIEAAEQEIVAAANLARRELKAFAAEVAVALAQQQLHIDAGTDEALVRSFASHLNGNSPANTSGKDGR
jgi:F0F1-type ATP synthase membrane subunit b/b'